jgi:hypothetical protein
MCVCLSMFVKICSIRVHVHLYACTYACVHKGNCKAGSTRVERLLERLGETTTEKSAFDKRHMFSVFKNQ